MNDFNSKIEQAFSLLNERLESEGLTLTVTCAGGYVLSHYGMRTTKDVDGFFASLPAINRAIKEVGDMLGLNTEDELWLNNSVQNLNGCPPAEICNPVYEYSNLTVLMPPLEYIAGMKLKSAREQDMLDVAEMIRILGIEDPISFTERLKELGFARTDESLVLEAFGTAYGMTWLEKYFIDNEEDILARL